MEDRKLATIEVIKDLQPIEGADFIEKATIRGWNCVVKKGEFQIGDFCIYIELDSFLPIKPEFEFLRKNCYKKMPNGTEGFRIKTQKLKGVISQGLVLPIHALSGNKRLLDDINIIPKNEIIYPTVEFVPAPEGHILTIFYDNTGNNYRELIIGDDVSNELNIIKFEPPIPAQLAGKVKGNFPSFLRKTDEERLQNMEWVLSEYKDELFYVTEKVDGCLDESCILETEDGNKTIKEICDTKYNGKIKSYDIDTNEAIWDVIIDYSIKENDNNWYELELETGEKIKLTGNHRVWLPELQCYRKVDELVGNEIFLLKD